MVISERTVIAFGLAGVVIGLSIATYIKTNPVATYTVKGTVTWLDPERNQAALEYIRPRTGRVLDKSLTIPAECEIRLNREPAKLADLRVGDHAVVTVRWTKATMALRALSIEVDRPAPNAAPPPTGQGTTQSM